MLKQMRQLRIMVIFEKIFIGKNSVSQFSSQHFQTTPPPTYYTSLFNKNCMNTTDFHIISQTVIFIHIRLGFGSIFNDVFLNNCFSKTFPPKLKITSF